jgi:hypothetical protein
MGILVFLLGLFSSLSGLYIIMRKEYQEAVKTLSSQSPKLAGKSPVDDLVVPLAQSSVQLMETLNKLIQTAVGVGAFLCLLGTSLCLVAYWMISN